MDFTFTKLTIIVIISHEMFIHISHSSYEELRMSCGKESHFIGKISFHVVM